MASLRARVQASVTRTVLLVALLAVSSGQATPPGRSPGAGRIWVAVPSTMAGIAALEPKTAALVFEVPTTYALKGGWDGATPAMGWASYGQFRSDLSAGLVPDDIVAVMYDPERWEQTPLPEQRSPARFLEAFSLLAKRHGYLVITTPHPNLVTVPGAACGTLENESVEEAYLRCGIQEAAARYSDITEIQAQYLQQSPNDYRAFVLAAARQARSVNPEVKVISGLSTNFATDPGIMYSSFRAVEQIVDGHYLNVPNRRHDVAAGFLRLVFSTP